MNAVVLPVSAFPKAYRGAGHTERGMDYGTQNICGGDTATENKRVARVQIYSFPKSQKRAVSNEVVAYDSSKTATEAMKWRRAAPKTCSAHPKKYGLKGPFRAAECPEGVLDGAVCERYAFVDDDGKTRYRYGVVQQRGAIFNSLYGESLTKGGADATVKKLGVKAAEQLRRNVQP